MPKRGLYRKTNNDKVYHTKEWRGTRNAFIKAYPLCAECERKGLVVSGYAVDHIIPIQKGGAVFNWDNLQTLCKRCHAIKSAKDK